MNRIWCDIKNMAYRYPAISKIRHLNHLSACFFFYTSKLKRKENSFFLWFKIMMFVRKNAKKKYIWFFFFNYQGRLFSKQIFYALHYCFLTGITLKKLLTKCISEYMAVTKFSDNGYINDEEEFSGFYTSHGKAAIYALIEYS